MEIETGRLPKDEQVPLLLRGLFEQRGYRRYRMSNFEAYDLYRENKNFLESEGIITFTDASVDGSEAGRYHEHRQAYEAGRCFQQAVLCGKRVPSGAAERRIPGDQPDGPGVHWRPGRLCRG